MNNFMAGFYTGSFVSILLASVVLLLLLKLDRDD